jgi:peptidoglycan hydrolase-like protein with peptidoglycan-binding domain
MKTAPTKAGAKTSLAASRTASGKKSVRRAPPAPPRQAAPTPERYKEIQKALADKGYLKSEPSGVWDAESIDAMRQYQTDRNLEPTGKLSAAALIDLGLGPKKESHEPAAGSAAQVPEPPKIETVPRPQ